MTKEQFEIQSIRLERQAERVYRPPLHFAYSFRRFECRDSIEQLDDAHCAVSVCQTPPDSAVNVLTYDSRAATRVITRGGRRFSWVFAQIFSKLK